MTELTLIIFAAMILAAITRDGYWRALAIGGATPVGAALVVGDVAVPTFYMAAIGALIGVVLRMLGRTRRFERLENPWFPGAVPLLLFAAWSVLVTLVAPLLFPGVAVLESDGSTRTLTAGVLTTSNLAQIVYLVLGVAVVFFLARSRRLGPGVVGVPATLVTLLSFWRFLSQAVGAPFPEGLFDNSPLVAFIETEPGGAPRFRGILSEPAGLAGASLIAIAYSLSRASVLTGWRRAGMIAVATMAAMMASISTSATFVVAAVALVLLAGLTLGYRVLILRGHVPHIAILGGTVLAVAALWLLPWAANTIGEVVVDKVDSTSFDQRSGADARAYEILLETVGIGVGLGSHRPSSFVAGLLSTTGVIGTVLFAAAVVSVVRYALPDRRFRPVLWALAAVLITKVIAGPDLADTSGILWLSIGGLAWAGSHFAAVTHLPAGTGSVAPGPTRKPDQRGAGEAARGPRTDTSGS